MWTHLDIEHQNIDIIIESVIWKRNVIGPLSCLTRTGVSIAFLGVFVRSGAVSAAVERTLAVPGACLYPSATRQTTLPPLHPVLPQSVHWKLRQQITRNCPSLSIAFLSCEVTFLLMQFHKFVILNIWPKCKLRLFCLLIDNLIANWHKTRNFYLGWI